MTVFFFLSHTLWDGASVAGGILESMNMVIHADRPNSVSARFKSPVTVCNEVFVSIVARRQRVLDAPDTWILFLSPPCAQEPPLPCLPSFPFPGTATLQNLRQESENPCFQVIGLVLFSSFLPTLQKLPRCSHGLAYWTCIT